MGRPKKRGRNPAADLTDDLVVEILSRLPAKSVCRFKCVSRRWRRRLIGHPDYRAKLPQTLSGFFRGLDTFNEGHGTLSSPYILSSDEDDDYAHFDGYESDDSDHDTTWTTVPDFVSVLGTKKKRSVVSDPALSFLPGYRSVVPKSCSNGLLLCLCWKMASTTESDYVVCNPATQQWVTVPGNGHRYRTLMRMHLAATASGHFHVFALLPDEFLDGYVDDVDIYSSETGAWSHYESAWENDFEVFPRSVFHHGMLHLVTMRLSCDQGSTIVWIRGGDGDGGDQWIFRYSIRSTGICGARISDLEDYSLLGIHPECNTVYFGLKRRRKYLLLSYDMDRGKVRVLSRNIRFGGWSGTPYLPYVPSFSRIMG